MRNLLTLLVLLAIIEPASTNDDAIIWHQLDHRKPTNWLVTEYVSDGVPHCGITLVQGAMQDKTAIFSALAERGGEVVTVLIGSDEWRFAEDRSYTITVMGEMRPLMGDRALRIKVGPKPAGTINRKGFHAELTKEEFFSILTSQYIIFVVNERRFDFPAWPQWVEVSAKNWFERCTEARLRDPFQ